ncbi:hypothetical protein J4Q44_G00368480 [Coregonus suidteri]|uniref:Uncharacterized protein n=1 Tax=Coregonus suidteri TaxID=861788 RepID=A0AAN8Q5E8_9TELE
MKQTTHLQEKYRTVYLKRCFPPPCNFLPLPACARSFSARCFAEDEVAWIRRPAAPTSKVIELNYCSASVPWYPSEKQQESACAMR